LGVPIGLIDSTWGGTVAEAWTSAEALAALEDFRPALSQVERIRTDLKSGAFDWQTARSRWFEQVDPGSLDSAWSQTGLDATDWSATKLPGRWEQGELGEFDGIVWYRKEFELPSGWPTGDTILHLGPIDDQDTTWVNGEVVGSNDVWNRPRDYRVPAGTLRDGQNVIAIRVLDTGGGGGVLGEPGQMRLEVDGESSTPALSLAGDWSFRKSVALGEVASPPQRLDNNPNVVTVLYNGMIAPLLPYPIKGAIWYQGESNASRAAQYRRLLPTMIQDWRARFQVGDFPFLIVQLANFMAVDSEPVDSAWAELREAQWLTTRRSPNTGLAVAIDIGEADDIHPRNKQEVGRRLALAARSLAYGQKLPFSGPCYRSMRRDGDRIRLQFDHVNGGLVVKGGGALRGFAVAGADGHFVWAEAVIKDDTVVVSSPRVAEPVSVRYAWANNPVCNLYNRAGLPAVPFRTDVGD
jgi:sialate O-acetylesterase